MENSVTMARTASPAIAPLGIAFDCGMHEALLEAEGVTVTVVTAPDKVADSPELEHPEDVVPLARIVVAALPRKGSVKMEFRVGSALATSRSHAVSNPHHQSGL
jgi:hypothetical protein